MVIDGLCWENRVQGCGAQRLTSLFSVLKNQQCGATRVRLGRLPTFSGEQVTKPKLAGGTMDQGNPRHVAQQLDDEPS
jgi:hypothetical protein